MIVPTLAAAGMETIVARLMRGLAHRGHDVAATCILSGGVLADELRSEGLPVAIVPTPGLRSNLYPTQLAERLRRREPTVVHVHSGAWLKAARAAHLAGVPHVMHTVHGIEGKDPWFIKPMWWMAVRYTDLVVSVSEPLLRYLDGEMRLPREKLRLVANGVDTDTFRPGTRDGTVRATLGVGADCLLVGNVARLATVKNQALLIDAFAIVHRHLPGARLTIIGEGPERHALEARIATLALTGDARLVGALYDLPALYRELDMYVLSSHIEGTSVSILEAMASGVCVVATAVGGTPDLLGQGRFGVLVPPDDPPALAAAIMELLRDPRRRRTLAAAAREHVVRHHGELEMVKRYEALYYGLADPHGVGGAMSRREGVCAE
jgi:glycosyltransferase involved in cell wall biosynthesis